MFLLKIDHYLGTDLKRFKKTFLIFFRWYYQSSSQLKGSSYKGILSYDGGGFVVDLSSDPTLSALQMQELFNNLWIDRATRVVFIDFTVYNSNINLFCQVKLVFF